MGTKTLGTKFIEASKAESLPGTICKIVGSCGAGLFAAGTITFIFTAPELVVGGMVLTAVMAVLGAPIVAFGSQTTQQKRATKLLELQVEQQLFPQNK